MKLNQGTIYTNDNCIGCNRCISVCPILGANISVTRNGQNHILVNDEKCLHCGHCIEACHHHARAYRDDTDDFLHALRTGEPVSLLVAPSFFLLYRTKAHRILGYLQSCGVRLVYDVSYGADIATWAYLSYLKEYPTDGAIAPPCPVITNYIRKYSKLLSDHMIPVYSPLLCLAVYVKRYLHNTDKLAFLSPCIAKADELHAAENAGLVDYNVTFTHLMEALEGVELGDHDMEISLSDAGLGRIYPTVGGLSENIRYFSDDSKVIRSLHGTRSVFDYLSELEERITKSQMLPYLIDCLNCSHGCLSGTATETQAQFDDDILFHLQEKRLNNPADHSGKNPYRSNLSLAERQRLLSKRFADLKLSDFIHKYDYKAIIREKPLPYDMTSPEFEKIFSSMHKYTQEARTIDCHSCGYGSCLEMAMAIYKGYNKKENCVHYMKDENLRIAQLDARTGIPNYYAFLNFTDQLILSGSIRDYTAIIFNIYHFKAINLKYGFQRGDIALKEYAHFVADLAGENELFAMVGGNDFIAIFHTANLENILHALSSTTLLSLSDTSDTVTVSARIAVYQPDGSDTSSQMLAEKLTSTYSFLTPEQTVIYYDNALREQALREDAVLNAIEPAMANHEFEVYYQPKVDMHSRRLVGAEALIRWKRDGHYILPMEFIPLCERTGLVQKLDFYVLHEVCHHIRDWLAQGIDVVPVSVNFSKQHFIDDTVADRIDEIADSYQIPRSYLEIEFTETAYLDDSRHLIFNIDKLHEYGISSSMDDFGTGYSSLSMLQNMSFNTLKLDKSFLNNGDFKKLRNHTVIKNIIRMAKQLDMSVVSEGIETEEELEYMKNMNCDIAQGYLFDRPLPHDEFEKRLKNTYYTA